LLGYVTGGMLQHFQIANAMDGKAVLNKEFVVRNTFPVSWSEYPLGLIHSDNYGVALILLSPAALVSVFPSRNRPYR